MSAPSPRSPYTENVDAGEFQAHSVDGISLAWMRENRRELLGRIPIRPQVPPDWVTHPGADAPSLACTMVTGSAAVTPTEDHRVFTQHASGPAVRQLEVSMHKILELWLKADYRELRHFLRHTVDELLAFDTREAVMFFFAIGGLDLFMRLLCDPPVFALSESAPHHDGRADFIAIVAEVTRVLFDNVTDCPELSWHIYDRYPGAIYRLLDFMLNPSLASCACTLLEQIISDIGPVLEVARNPTVARIIESPDMMVAACGCRLLALLVIPGISMGLSPFTHRRLTTREMIRDYKRLQRVADSNVLWMLRDESLIERLIKLCEMKPSKRSSRERERVRLAAEYGGTPFIADAEYAQLIATNAGVPGDTALPSDDGTLARILQGAANAVQRFTGENGAMGAPGRGAYQQLMQIFSDFYNSTTSDQPAATRTTNDGVSLTDLAAGAGMEGGVMSSGRGSSVAANPTQGLNSTQGVNSGNAIEAARAAALAAAAGDARREDLEYWEEEEGEYAEPMGVRATTNESAEDRDGAEWEDVDEEEEEREENTHDDRGTGSRAESQRTFGRSYSAGDGGNATTGSATIAATVLRGAEAEDEEEGEFYDEEEEEYSGTRVDNGEEGAMWGDGPSSEEDEYIEEDPDDDSAKRSLNWLLGSVDTRERWRLREPTLTRERDDNRLQLYGYANTPEDVRRFYYQDKKALGELREYASKYPFPTQKYDAEDKVLASQTESLYLLNVILSTFYFSTPWRTLKSHNWLKRANGIFNVVFAPSERNGLPGKPSPEVHLTEREIKLPRFLKFNRPAKTSTETTSLAAKDASTAAASLPLPNGYVFPPLEEVYGKRCRAAFASDHGATSSFQDDEFFEPKEGMQSPDTVRKLELLRGVHEFWNAQDRYEANHLRFPDAIATSAVIAKKVAEVLVSCREDCDVDMNSLAMLEIYLRVFSHVHGPERGGRGTPQTEIGRTVLGHIFKQRIYNAARVPGLAGSLSPRCRIEYLNAMLAEVLLYHYSNLSYLCSWVKGAVELTSLNRPFRADAHAAGRDHEMRSAQDEEEARVRAEPPLAREEFEPFGSVLLRRIYRYGFESHMLVRALVFSLTPGLRSKENYVAKGPDQSAIPWRLIFTDRTPSQDYVTGNLQRMTFVRRTSLTAAVRVSLLIHPTPTDTSAAATSTTTDAALATLPPEVGEEIVTLVQALCRAPHRLPLSERAFPDLFDAYDLDIVRGNVDPPPVGPEAALGRSLFGPSATDAFGMRALAPLAAVLLAEPHRLVFSLLRAVDADAIEDILVLGGITSSLAVFMREAKLHGMRGGIRNVLDAIRPLAKVEYNAWRAEVNESRRHQNVLRQYLTVDASCNCEVPASYAADTPELEGSYRCSTYTLFGSCMPEHETKMYFQQFGGCFYRNYFRVLCVWIAHYASCQRYTETVFYCTEVPFAEFKYVCMCVMGELPKYFQEPLLNG